MEKRQAERKQKRLYLKVENDEGKVIDISERGLRVSVQKIPENELVDINMKIRDRSFNLQGTIHWVEIKQTLGEEPYEIGLSIKNPGKDFLSFVDSL